MTKRTKKLTAEPAASWQLHTAKARFSEVFRLARSQGPQVITRQGKEAVVMLPLEDFERLSHRRRQPKSLVQFFRESPVAGETGSQTRQRSRPGYLLMSDFLLDTVLNPWDT